MSSKSRRIVIGIDPSSGASSPVGLGVFDPDTKEVIVVEEVRPKKSRLEHRLREIRERVDEVLSKIEGPAKVYVFIESTYIKGRGNQAFQQGVGAIKSAVPFEFKLEEVGNTEMKKLVTGKGTADKDEVAAHALLWLYGKGAALNAAYELYSRDETDALAIGVAGWLKHGAND